MGLIVTLLLVLVLVLEDQSAMTQLLEYEEERSCLQTRRTEHYFDNRQSEIVNLQSDWRMQIFDCRLSKCGARRPDQRNR